MTWSWQRAMVLLYLALLLGGGLAVFARGGDTATGAPDARRPTAVILAINDVYRIAGIADGAAGGLARLRALRAELERDYPDLLMLHAGDLLFPSFMSRTFNGRQMIDVMNLLDGDPRAGSFDERLLVTFGNHEFDEADCGDPEILRNRVSESDFQWLISNVDFADCGARPPLLSAAKVLDRRLVEVGGIRLGLFALTVDPREIKPGDETPYPRFLPRLETARRLAQELRAAGAQVVVALTHLPIEEDLALLARAGAAGPDLIVGGHDHTRMALPAANPRVFKADADAVTASIIRITLDDDGKPVIEQSFRDLDVRVAKEPVTEARTQLWVGLHGIAFCQVRGLPEGCLAQPLGRTNTLLEAEELKVRGGETALGDWLADQMRTAFPDVDVAVINGGTLRLNYDLPAGGIVRRQQMEELFGFPVPLYQVTVTGGALWAALQHSLDMRGSGGWLHVSNLAFAADRAGRLTRALAKRADGTVEALSPDSAATYRLTASSFILCGGDGYAFRAEGLPADRKGCHGELVKRNPEPEDLKALIAAALRAAPGGISPVVDGRVCLADVGGCLIEAWAR